METEPLTEIQRRARQTFDLFQTAVDLMRQNLRRRHPEASPEEIAERLRAWMLSRPDAPHGDAAGPVRVRK